MALNGQLEAAGFRLVLQNMEATAQDAIQRHPVTLVCRDPFGSPLPGS